MADYSLLEKVLGLQEKYEGLQAQLSDPEVISDMKKFVQLNKEYKELTPIIEAGNEFKRILENYEMAKEILATEKDEDLREMAKEEIAEIEPTLPEWEEKIKILLIPADPQDSKKENSIDPEAFVDFYASKGWMIGKNKMKDWKAAVRTWEQGDKRKGVKNSGGNRKPVESTTAGRVGTWL